MLGNAPIEGSVFNYENTFIRPPLLFIIIMYIELREKNEKYYVIIRKDGDKGKQVAQFASNNKTQSENVARQYAKQNKCLVRFTSGGIETPELPPQPAGEA